MSLSYPPCFPVTHELFVDSIHFLKNTYVSRVYRKRPRQKSCLANFVLLLCFVLVDSYLLPSSSHTALMPPKAQKNGNENAKAASSKPAPAPKAAVKKAPSEEDASEAAVQATGSVKPDQVAYNKEQDALKAQIDAQQAKLVRPPTPYFFIRCTCSSAFAQPTIQCIVIECRPSQN